MEKKINKKKFTFGREFQFDLLKMMLENVGFMLLCKKYVKPEFFTDEILQRFVLESYKFFDKYRILPDKTFLKSISKEKKERIYVVKIFKKRALREQYIRDKVEEFVKKSMFIDSYVESGKVYNKNPEKPDKAYEMMMEGMNEINMVSMNEDSFHFFYKGFDKRIMEREHKKNTNQYYKVRTGIKELDMFLRGGPGGGEVWLFLGDAKSGKSLGLIHIGIQAVKRFMPVLHFQLEGKIDETLDRYDSAYLGAKYDSVVKNEIPQDLLDRMYRTSETRNKKDLVVRGFTEWDSCSILDIERDYLELVNRGYDFKVVIIDYMDLMKARKNYSANEERHRQQSIIRDLKTFATKYNVLVWTATQANRGDEKTRNEPNFLLTSKNLSEDYGKVRAVDGLISINCTEDEYSKGTARLWLDQARSNRGKRLIRIKRILNRSMFYVPRTKYSLYNETKNIVFKSRVKKKKVKKSTK